jgi:serine-type D-Ala-D-Ala carboxypeptidase/endopeptidase (penicillin-binding protein 4)
MKSYQLWAAYFLPTIFLAISPLNSSEKDLPEEMKKVMHQKKYEHSLWGIYVKDMQTGEILFDLNSDKLFSPASTTKLFSIAALLHTFGDDYRFKTPVFSSGKIENGQLQGTLILVAQGDLTMGGRELNTDKIAFTKMDHIYELPGVILTKEDPLHGLNELAKQVYQKGIKEINGDVIIDDSLFETIEKREMVLNPIIINDNLIDIVINPTGIGQKANLTWRPKVPGYAVDNQMKTVAKENALAIDISSDDLGHNILVKGTIPIDQHDLVRTFSIKDPKSFARAAFIQALEQNGVKVHSSVEKTPQNQSLNSYKDLHQVALWTSPPLSEYAKLILKVSHNLGADLVPLLLASHQGKKTFVEGMRMLGDFVIQKVKLSPNSFVFIDAAGGNENRLTPQAEIQLLEYVRKQTPKQFQHFFDALPILGVDGSLEDFGKKTQAAGKVRAKPGTGASFNLATGNYFLITQAFAGYLEGKNGHLFAYIVIVNNAAMPAINDVFSIFEDESQLSNMIYNHSGSKN